MFSKWLVKGWVWNLKAEGPGEGKMALIQLPAVKSPLPHLEVPDTLGIGIWGLRLDSSRRSAGNRFAPYGKT